MGTKRGKTEVHNEKDQLVRFDQIVLIEENIIAVEDNYVGCNELVAVLYDALSKSFTEGRKGKASVRIIVEWLDESN